MIGGKNIPDRGNYLCTALRGGGGAGGGASTSRSRNKLLMADTGRVKCKKYKKSLGRQVGSDSLKTLWDMPRTLAFIMKAVGIHWKILGREGHGLICVPEIV